MNHEGEATRSPCRRLVRYGLIVLVVVGVGGAGWWQWAGRGEHEREYTAGQPALSMPFKLISYPFGDSKPFEDGRFWIYVLDAKEQFRSCRFDLETMAVVGYTETTPVVFDERRNRRLYEDRPRRPEQSGTGWLEKIGLRPKYQDEDPVDFWLYSGPAKRHVRLGTVHQRKGTTTTGHPSPQLDYYQLDSCCQEHVMIDLDRGVMTSMPAIQMGLGWWSDEECLIMTPDHSLGLYNARTSQLCNLISFAQINQFVQSHGLVFEADPWLPFRIDGVWNGDHYEFFMAVYLGSKMGWLARIEKPDGKLQLISRNVPFTYMGRLNGAGTHYVFTGEIQNGDGNAVYVYDVQTSKTTTLVPGARAEKYYSLPNYYKNKIIFIQKGALRIMDLDGSNQRVIFPPETMGKK